MAPVASESRGTAPSWLNSAGLRNPLNRLMSLCVPLALMRGIESVSIEWPKR